MQDNISDVQNHKARVFRNHVSAKWQLVAHMLIKPKMESGDEKGRRTEHLLNTEL